MRYLLVTYVKKPDGKIDEMVGVGKNIKKRDVQTANVIMDFSERKVVKCLIDGQRVDTDWDNLYMYYKGVYPNIIDRLSEENGWRGEIIPSDSDDQVTDIEPKYVQ
jgi:predicted glycosyltransferase involved in capsule biosynthesis